MTDTEYLTTSQEEMVLRGLAAGEVGVWSWDRRTNQLYWSPNLEGIHRLPPGTFDGTFSVFERDIHSADRTMVMESIKQALAERGAYRVEYRLAESDDDEPRWLEARGRVLEDADGEVIGMTGVCQDITARRRGEGELRRRTRQQEAIARIAQLAIAGVGDRVHALFNAVVAETAEVLDVELCTLLELMPGGNELFLRAGVGWKPGIVGTARIGTDRASQSGYTLKAGGAVVVSDFLTETRFSPSPLLREYGVASGLSVLVAGEDGRDYGVLAAHSTRRRQFTQSDVDFLSSAASLLASAIHRNRAVERQELLVRELRHRVGNLLSLIMSLFNNSAGGAHSVAELEEKFLARLMSLSRAHSIISQGGWQTTCMRGLVDAVLEPYSGRIEIDGGDVGISADSSMALSLAIHELATNATKHGALSTRQGKVSVSWSVIQKDGQSLLVLDWIERDGPATSAPHSQGFGTKLVHTVIERQLNGSISADYARTGLKVRFEIPLA